MNLSTAVPLHIQRASPGDEAVALELVFAHLPVKERTRHVAQLVAEAVGQPLTDLWGGYRGQRLVAAMLAQVQAGRIAFVSPPRLAPDEPHETARDLSTYVLNDLAQQGVRLVQALLTTDHGPDVERLTDADFRHVTNLLYLVSLSGTFPTSPPHDGLAFVRYRAEDHERLAAIIERTYQDSLDCPDIDKARSIEEVLEGYRGTGVFDPARWLIAANSGVDVGCVLLTDHPRIDVGTSLGQWELMYMGVVPEARGRGFGVAIARHAQWLAHEAGRERLTLAVDATNTPAIDVYAAAGFVAWDHASVFLRSLRARESTDRGES